MIIIKKTSAIYALIGFLLGILPHLFLYTMGVSVMGFFPVHIPPMLLRTIPSGVALALVFSIFGKIRNKKIRVIAFILITVVWIYLFTQIPW
jgi:hypothetical protein